MAHNRLGKLLHLSPINGFQLRVLRVGQMIWGASNTNKRETVCQTNGKTERIIKRKGGYLFVEDFNVITN